jgi:hypothetical protein
MNIPRGADLGQRVGWRWSPARPRSNAERQMGLTLVVRDEIKVKGV